MIWAVIGTPDSGKSREAERLCLELAGDGPRVYLATMIPYGSEGEARARRHRSARQGKGFITMEVPYDLASILPGLERPSETTVLLECLSNLVANEMFERQIRDPRQLDRTIRQELLTLDRSVKHLVVVSNHFEKTGDGETDAYIEAQDRANLWLASMSRKVILL